MTGCGTNQSSTNKAAQTSNTTGTASTNQSTSHTNASASTGASTNAYTNFRVALLTDTGGLNDHSFNQLSYEGLKVAESKLGVKGAVVQSKSESDYVPNLTRFAQQGYDLVIAVGSLMTDAVEQVSKQYPKTKFLIIDSAITDRPNVTGAVFKTEQSAYLAGALAGLLEQSTALKNLNSKNVIGVVAWMKIPPVEEYIAGYQQGFKKTDPSGTLLINWTNSFSDEALGQQVANSQISKGSDLEFQLAGGAGLGVIQAAKDLSDSMSPSPVDTIYKLWLPIA